MAEYIEKRLYKYEGYEIYVHVSFDNRLFKAWFDGDEDNAKHASDPNRAITKLWNYRRKLDGKTTQARYIPLTAEQRNRVRTIESVNDPKPIHKKKVKTFHKPPTYVVKSIDKYRPAKVSQHRRGPPTTPALT